MNNDEKIKSNALTLLGLDNNATIEEIESKMKEAIRDPKLHAREYNIISRCASLLRIDLTPELRKIDEENKLNELYEKKGPTIFTLLSNSLGVTEDEVKTYSHEDIINLAERLVASSNLSVKEYNIILRGISTIESYLNANKVVDDVEVNDNNVNKPKK